MDWDILWLGYHFSLCDFIFFHILLLYASFYVFCALLWCGNARFGFLFSLQGNDDFGLNMVYYLGYFHVMFYMCDDNNSYRCQHRNASHKCKNNWLFQIKTHYGWLHNFVTTWLLTMEKKKRIIEIHSEIWNFYKVIYSFELII
jgi:hypothetical protein